MANNLTLSVTLTGDGKQLSGTLRDARNDVREFGTTTERESRKADTALTAPGRSAVTVSEHLRDAGREARTFGTETAQGGRVASQALSQTSGEAQTVTGHLDQLRTVAAGVGVALATIGARDFVMNAYAAVSSSQQLQGSLKTVTGSIENASTAWDTLLGFAAETPFTLDQSVQAFIRMQSLGLNPSLEALRSYGNTASAMGKDMMQMVEAVADATTGEFERLKEFGIRASKEGEQISFTFQGVTTTVTNSAAAISQYLQQIGENQFAGAMGDQMDTLSGKASNLEDTIYQFYLAVGDAGAADIFESTLANASNTVQFLTDNIDTLAAGAEVMAVLIGGRVVVALANVTAAKVLATQQTIAYQLALARMAGVSGTAAAAQTALAGATRAASGAMMLLGGPAGAVALAGLAIYTFRDELGLTIPQIDANTTAVNQLTNGLDDMSQAAAQLTLTSLVGQLAEVRAQAEVTAEEFQKVGQIEGDGGGGFLGVDVTAQTNAVRELGEISNATQQEAANLEAAIALVEGRIGQLGERNREVTPTVTEIGDASEIAAAKTNELTKAAAAQADALDDLRNRLRPGRREVVQLADDMRTLTLAIATGTGNVAENIQMIGLLQQRYIEAQNDTNDLAAKSEDAGSRIASSFTTWGTVADNTIRRVDDSGKDLWLGLIDGSRNAMDTVKRGIQESLAEIAHMLTTQKFTVQVAGMLGLDTTGMAGGGNGGFNLNSLGSLGRSASSLLGLGGSAAAPSLGMQGGLSSAALASAGQVAGGAAYGGWAGSAASGAALGNAASGGIMSAITSGVSAAMPWIAGGLAIDSLLGGGITKAIGSLFGGGKTNPHLNIDTRATDNYGHGSVRTGAFGAVGFAQGTRRSNDLFGGIPEEREFLAAVAASDDLLASLARSPEELDRMATAVQGVRLSASNVEGIMGHLSNRTVAAVKAIDGDFGAFVSNLGTDVDTIIARTQSAMAALNLLGSASENLNLQFDASATGALRAADNIAQFAGGVDQLNQLQNSYYQAFFTDAERAANLQRELTSAVGQLGYALPSTRDGFRALIEQQNQMTESGQQNYVQLLQLAGSFNQLQTLLQQTGVAVDGVSQSFEQMLADASAVITDAESQVRQAWQTFDRQAFSQQIELLNLIGDAEGALALERERELATIDEALRPTQERIWSIQDEIAVQQNATQAARNYQNEVARVRDQLNQQLGNIGNWLDQQQATSGTPEMNLATAQEQLARQLVLIENGDRTALQNITQYAQQVLEANQAFNASSAAGQRIQEDVYAAIRTLPDLLSAEEYLATEIRDALQSVVISAMPTDERLAFELSRELIRLDTNQLTVSQVRTALAPIATDAEISKLIREVDTNGDGIITRQELGNARLSGLAGGIGATLKPMFDAIDLDTSGLIDWNEFYGAFNGLASDQELRRIFQKLDADGSGTISRLEALNRSNEGTEENTDSLEKQARDQLRELGGLVAEMARTTDQFVGLNTTMVSLKDSINALGVAQAEVARIEREREAAEIENKGRVEASRLAYARGDYNSQLTVNKAEESRLASQLTALERQQKGSFGRDSSEQTLFRDVMRNNPNQADIDRMKHAISLDTDGWINIAGAGRIRDDRALAVLAEVEKQLKVSNNLATTQRELERVQRELANIRSNKPPTTTNELEALRRQYKDLMGQAAPFATGGIFDHGRVVDTSTRFSIGEMGEAGPEMILPVEKMANGKYGMQARLAFDMPTLPRFPLLGNSDIVEPLRDLKREVAELRRDNARLQGESNKHLAAANNQRGAAATQQIAATERGNRMLKKLEDDKRLEAAKR